MRKTRSRPLAGRGRTTFPVTGGRGGPGGKDPLLPTEKARKGAVAFLSLDPKGWHLRVLSKILPNVTPRPFIDHL